jgi:hypothetical protein
MDACRYLPIAKYLSPVRRYFRLISSGFRLHEIEAAATAQASNTPVRRARFLFLDAKAAAAAAPGRKTLLNRRVCALKAAQETDSNQPTY